VSILIENSLNYSPETKIPDHPLAMDLHCALSIAWLSRICPVALAGR